MRFGRWKLHLSVAGLAVAAMTVALTPAVADPLSGTDEYPDVAFLARNDVPFDAQTAASMAAQLGAPMFITNPNVLGDAARDGIADLNPDVIIVAGGIFAISEDVANAAAGACDPDCTIDRRFGAGRDQTAADLATIATDYGFDRPVLQGIGQVVGDVNIGGTLSVDDLTIQDTETVSGLNADQLDDKHASELTPRTASATFDSVKDLDTAVTNVGSVEIVAPVAGRIIAHAHGNLVTFGAETVGDLGIADSATELETSTPGVARAGLLDGTDSTRRTWSAAPMATFDVAPGTHSIYLNAQKSSVFDIRQINLGPTVLNLTFVPAN